MQQIVHFKIFIYWQILITKGSEKKKKKILNLKSGDSEIAYHLLLRNSQKFYKFDISLGEHQKDLIYLFSIICIKLLKYPQAEKGLNILYNQNNRDYSVLYWLGMIMRFTERTKKSISFFQKCLDLNPYMFSAYEQICQLGK